MNIILVALFAIVGALLAATLGWLDSGEVFDFRRFASSIITAVISGVTFASTYNYTQVLPTPMLIILALLGGVGIDYGSKKIAGAVNSRTTPKPPSP